MLDPTVPAITYGAGDPHEPKVDDLRSGEVIMKRPAEQLRDGRIQDTSLLSRP